MKSTKRVLPLLVSVFALMIILPRLAKADDATTTIADATTTAVDVPAPVNINLDVEGPSSTIYSSNLSVPACTTPNNATSTVNGFCAFAAANLPINATWSSYGALVNSIGGVAGDVNDFWLWFLNGEPAQKGIDSYTLQPNDNVLWALGREPLKVSLSTTTPALNANTTITVLGFNPVNFDFEPLAGAQIVGTSAVTDASGTAAILATSTTPFVISVTANGFLPSQQFTITPVVQPSQISLTIRDVSGTVFSGNVALPDPSAPDLSITPSNTTTPIAVSPRSVLGLLESLQASSTAFNITNLAYYPPSASFPSGSFLLNCIAVPAGSTTPDCFDWTYAVGSPFPQIGIDQQLLNDGDSVYLFFGQQHQVELSATSTLVGQPFTATAQQYDLSSGSYKPLTGVTIGVGTPHTYPVPFAELATSTVNSLGQAVFTLNATGTFAVGIKDYFYFPSSSITITDSTSTPPVTPPSGGGGGGSGSISHQILNISKALGFISASQNSDGSFSSPLITDWTAIAFAADDPGSAKTKLRSYLLNTVPASSDLTDYERHAMALEAFGINPYSGTSVNYIAAITNAFDGTQFGTSEDNDDIFAQIVLQHAGYSSADSIIQKDAASIIASQLPDGSWDESPDLTAAAIQALGSLFDINGVNAALGKAAGYLASGEKSDGSWGNIDSTSWVQTAINAIIEAQTPGFTSESAWATTSGLFPTDALAEAQQADGGVQSSGNRVWSTGYAVVAASGKSWVTILQSFSKPANSGDNTGGSAGTGSVLGTSTVASLAAASTSTPVIATSTAPVINLAPISTPIIKIPSTTPLTIKIKPKEKIYKSLVKKPKLPQPSAVLGAITNQPNMATVPTPTQFPVPPVSSHKGFFGSLWQAVASFFL